MLDEENFIFNLWIESLYIKNFVFNLAWNFPRKKFSLMENAKAALARCQSAI